MVVGVLPDTVLIGAGFSAWRVDMGVRGGLLLLGLFSGENVGLANAGVLFGPRNGRFGGVVTHLEVSMAICFAVT